MTRIALILFATLIFPAESAWAVTEGDHSEKGNLTAHPLAVFCLTVFVLSYIVALFEKKTQLRKSKPVMLWACYLRKTSNNRDKDVDIRQTAALSEWNTLPFFFGVLFSIGGLTFFGYLEPASAIMYDGWDHSATSIMTGDAAAVYLHFPVNG